MALKAGDRFGPYEILAAIGRGGMGEVFRARDTRLLREVAVKALPESFADDPDRVARFQREAQVLAALNHPNVASIYGLEERGTERILILELVEGPTLAERLQAGPISVPEVLRLASHIATALEAAHERGIIHRDLKPANIKITTDGSVKVLDFGLARVFSDQAEAADPAESPTLTAVGTRMGVILGTAAYMSPEQARGGRIDKRTDIWAFGCVLYEMLTGRRSFEAPTVSDTIVAVLDRAPDWDALPPGVSLRMQRLLRRCLEKDPRRRLRDIGDARLELEDVDVVEPVTHRSSVARHTPGMLPWLAGLAMLVAGVAIGWSFRPMPVPLTPPSFGQAVRLTATSAHETAPAISPDGKWVAYVSDVRGVNDVWVKFIAGGDAANLTATSDLDIQLRSTIGALEIAPDGSSIAVQARRKGSNELFNTWLIPAPLGGIPRLFVQGAALRWSNDGKQVAYIRPAGTGGDALWVADANGDNPRELVPARGGFHNHGPAWSPDGHYVYFNRTIANWNDEPAEIYRVPVTGGAPEAVVSTTRRAIFPALSANGDLFYSANPAGVDLNLWWQPRRDATPHRLTTGVGEYAEPRVSSDGRLLVSTLIDYRRWLISAPLSPSVQGKWREVTDGFGGDADPTISADGRMVFSSSRSGNRNLWIAKEDGSEMRPLTSDNAIEERPKFSADGRQIAFVSDRTGQRGIWVVSADGGPPRRLLNGPILDSVTWSPDAKQIAYAIPGERLPALSIVTVDDGSNRRVTTPHGAYSPAWSPRDDLIAYIETTGESGGVGNHLRFVSSAGQPMHVDLPAGPRLPNGYVVWAPDGKRLAVVSVLTNAPAEIWVVELGAPNPFRQALVLPSHFRVRGLTFSSDSSSLVIGVQEALSDIVLFVRDGR